MACFSLILAEDPYKYGDRVLHMGLTYLGNQLHLSGPECVSEALDADILHTVLKLERLFPWSSNLFVNIVGRRPQVLNFSECGKESSEGFG